MAKADKLMVSMQVPIMPNVLKTFGVSVVSWVALMAPWQARVTVVRVTPVRVQTRTVHKGPVEATSACWAGFAVLTAAETMGDEPKPASVANRLRQVPVRMANMMVEPMKPPVAACVVNAHFTMCRSAGPI